MDQPVHCFNTKTPQREIKIQVTLTIGDDVREQNRLLRDMDSDFDSNRNLLTGAMRRLGIVSSAGGILSVNLLDSVLKFHIKVTWLRRDIEKKSEGFCRASTVLPRSVFSTRAIG